MSFCMDCDVPLTAEEAYFYSTRCERCERLWMIRVEEWRHGRREDAELDKLYGAPPTGDST